MTFVLFCIYSEKSSESDVDGLDDLVVEEEPEELVFKSDHEFSPESDLDDEAETVQPTKHARTARAGKHGVLKCKTPFLYLSLFFPV